MSVDLPQMWSTAYATIRVSSCIARRTPSPEIKRASEEARFMSWRPVLGSEVHTAAHATHAAARHRGSRFLLRSLCDHGLSS
jgi:hypothetical protein